MTKKTRFLIGFLLIALAYTIPLAIAILMQEIWILLLILVGFFGSVYLLYHVTLKGKPKYPIVPPTGKPDIYTGLAIPRPIYEDMEQNPWFFKKKSKKQKWIERTKTKKVKKKH